MASLEDFDTGTCAGFSAEIDGIAILHLIEADGLKIENEIISCKMNEAKKGKYVIRNLPGKQKAGEITLKRYWHAHNGFKDWMETVGLGQTSAGRKNGVVSLLDTEGNRLQGFEFVNGLAKSLALSAVKAGSSEPLIETLVIAHEGCKLAS